MAIDQRWVWGGIAVGGAGLAIYMYNRDKKLKAQTAAQTAQANMYAYGYGSGYAYGYGMEPLTYEPYGYGYGPFGLGAYGGVGNYGYGYYGAGYGGVPAPVPQQATTNAQWSQAAMSALTSAGYSATSVLAALGVYLIGGNLSADQATIVTAAIGAEGYPPVAGANGYPPAMHTGGTPGGGQTSHAGPISNLEPSRVTNSGFTVTWNAATGASGGYSWAVTDTSGGGIIRKGSGQQRSVTVTGLKSKHVYNFGVQALPGGSGNNIHITTA